MGSAKGPPEFSKRGNLRMSSLMAFIHHFVAFTMIAAIAVELVLIRENLSLSIARKLLFADLVFGVSAAGSLMAGFIRVFYFEKGAGYYFTNIPFLAKLALLGLIGYLSLRPTKEFLSWRTAMKRRQAPLVSEAKQRQLRDVLLVQLAAATLLILCSALMAKGVGSVG